MICRSASWRWWISRVPHLALEPIAVDHRVAGPRVGALALAGRLGAPLRELRAAARRLPRLEADPAPILSRSMSRPNPSTRSATAATSTRQP